MVVIMMAGICEHKQAESRCVIRSGFRPGTTDLCHAYCPLVSCLVKAAGIAVRRSEQHDRPS